MKPTLLGLKIETERLRHGPTEHVLAEDPAIFDLLDDPEYTFSEPVRGTLKASIVGTDTVLLRGTVQTIAEVPCARCLERLRVPLRAAIHLAFMTDDRLLDPDAYPELADDSTLWFDGEAIYPAEALRELLLLELPPVAACELEEGDVCPIRGVKVGPLVFGPTGDEETPAAEPPGPGSLRDQIERLRGKLDNDGEQA